MADAVDREQMRGKIVRMQHRIRQRRDGPYKVGYQDACKDALQKLDECDGMRLKAVVECHECRHASERHTTMPYCALTNRRKAPDDYCRFGEKDYE